MNYTKEIHIRLNVDKGINIHLIRITYITNIHNDFLSLFNLNLFDIPGFVFYIMKSKNISDNRNERSLPNSLIKTQYLLVMNILINNFVGDKIRDIINIIVIIKVGTVLTISLK